MPANSVVLQSPVLYCVSRYRVPTEVIGMIRAWQLGVGVLGMSTHKACCSSSWPRRIPPEDSAGRFHTGCQSIVLAWGSHHLPHHPLGSFWATELPWKAHALGLCKVFYPVTRHHFRSSPARLADDGTCHTNIRHGRQHLVSCRCLTGRP